MKKFKFSHAIWLAAHLIQSITCASRSEESEKIWMGDALSNARELVKELNDIINMED